MAAAPGDRLGSRKSGQIHPGLSSNRRNYLLRLQRCRDRYLGISWHTTTQLPTPNSRFPTTPNFQLPKGVRIQDDRALRPCPSSDLSGMVFDRLRRRNDDHDPVRVRSSQLRLPSRGDPFRRTIASPVVEWRLRPVHETSAAQATTRRVLNLGSWEFGSVWELGVGSVWELGVGRWEFTPPPQRPEAALPAPRETPALCAMESRNASCTTGT